MERQKLEDWTSGYCKAIISCDPVEQAPGFPGKCPEAVDAGTQGAGTP